MVYSSRRALHISVMAISSSQEVTLIVIVITDFVGVDEGAAVAAGSGTDSGSGSLTTGATGSIVGVLSAAGAGGKIFVLAA
mgnify:CR=1 FL=1